MVAFKKSIFMLSPDIDYLDKQIDVVINNLSTLYYTSCMPRVVLDNNGHMKDIVYHWTSKDAHDNYEKLQSILSMLLKEKNKSLLGDSHVRY